MGSCNNFPELLENLNEDFGTLLDCLNLLGEIVIPLYYFDADNFGDISDKDFRTVIDICKKDKVRYYRDSKNKGKDSGVRIFWGETSINNEKVAISAVNAEKKIKYHLLTVEDFYSKSNILKLCRIKVLEINF